MGAYGPIPNRSNDTARPRERQGRNSDQTPLKRGVLRDVVIPEPDPDWHPIATMLWESLARSGQSDFYQQSDWAYAYSVCDDLSMYKKPSVAKDGTEYHKRSGQMAQVIYSAMSNLLVTEGDRRRVRVELEEEVQAEDASLHVMADYKANVAGG